MKPTTKPPQNGAKRADATTTLSPRQQQMVELVAQGVSNAKIAAKLGIAPATVRRHLADIHRRTGHALRSVTLAVGVVAVAGGVSDPQVVATTIDADKAQGLEPETSCTGGAYVGQRGSVAQSAARSGSARNIQTAQTPAKPLSLREDQVRKLAAQGKLDKQIAMELGISYNTVKNHERRIRLKLGVPNMKAAIHQLKP
ncbi:MAG: LuxR C-terminal-related transcriptional regulator [Verrucomicrobiota bacterium]|jgi:DNA-binding CsgD family transcriptional regulator